MLPTDITIELPAELAAVARSIDIKKGEIFLQPHEVPDYAYMIKSGIVKIYSEKSNEIVVQALYGKGDVFTYTSLFFNQELAFYYQALTDCTFTMIPKDMFVAAAQSNPQFSYMLLQQCITLVSVFKYRVDNLEFKYARERLAYRVLFLAARFGDANGAYLRLPPISQEVLGATINLSRETVSKEIKRFVRLGFVRTKSSRLEITDVDGLIAEAGFNGDLPLFLQRLKG